jgi:hypothetical protein
MKSPDDALAVGPERAQSPMRHGDDPAAAISMQVASPRKPQNEFMAECFKVRRKSAFCPG